MYAEPQTRAGKDPDNALADCRPIPYLCADCMEQERHRGGGEMEYSVFYIKNLKFIVDFCAELCYNSDKIVFGFGIFVIF